jgi:hypothetical protein
VTSSNAHAYVTYGNSTITVTFKDADNTTGSTTSSVTVGDLYKGMPANLTVASYTCSEPTATEKPSGRDSV